MKLIKIFLILSLVIFSFARITRKNEANLSAKTKLAKSKILAKAKSRAKGVLEKLYNGELSIGPRDKLDCLLNANDLRFSNQKGITFKTKDLGDIVNKTINNFLIKITNGIYYLPYIITTEIHFLDGGVKKDYFYTYINKKYFRFTFVAGSWGEGSGQSLTQNINHFRAQRIGKFIIDLKSLSKFATNYFTAKQGMVAAGSSLADVETQITKASGLIADRTTLRVADLETAHKFVSQLLEIQTSLAVLRKEASDLSASNVQKLALMAQLTNAIVQFNAQKTSGSINSDKNKADMEDNSQNFIATLSLLKDEAVSDSDKIGSASDALIKTFNLDSAVTILKTIMP